MGEVRLGGDVYFFRLVGATVPPKWPNEVSVLLLNNKFRRQLFFENQENIYMFIKITV